MRSLRTSSLSIGSVSSIAAILCALSACGVVYASKPLYATVGVRDR